MDDEDARKYESPASVALKPRGYEWEPKLVRSNASYRTNTEIKLAFQAMLDLAERIDAATLSPYCNCATRTGRAIKAAMFAAAKHPSTQRVAIWQKLAASIVIGVAVTFLAGKNAARPGLTEHLLLWNVATLMMLSGRSSANVADMCRVDRRTIERRRDSDLEAIEWKYGVFLRKYVPKSDGPLCYTYNNGDDEHCSVSLSDDFEDVPDQWGDADLQLYRALRDRTYNDDSLAA